MAFLMKRHFFEVIVVYLLVALSLVSGDICDFCECNNGDTSMIIKCSTKENTDLYLSLENLQWPTKNLSMDAYFRGLKYDKLPKILGAPQVRSLHLDDNGIAEIQSNTFSLFPNIETISISRNLISHLPKDFLSSAHNVRHLNLSDNLLTNISDEILSKWKTIETLDLSFNEIKKISSGSLLQMPNLRRILLNGNQIIQIDRADDDDVLPNQLVELSLARNMMNLIGSNTFADFHEIESLDLSHNSITTIESDSFIKMKRLKVLNLSHNQLAKLSIQIPDSLECLILNNNLISAWPLENNSPNLIILQLSINSLTSLYPYMDENVMPKLKELNVSHNAIKSLPKGSLEMLEILDVSYNKFSKMPDSLPEKFPMLDRLVLDSNPIQNIELSASVGKLSLNNMPLLNSIEEDALSGVYGRDCLELSISNCPQLQTIHQNAFRELRLCSLDLSNNQLTSIPQNLTDWALIKGFINIQGNPFNCDCNSEWMLDSILVPLYDNLDYQQYLAELRCHTPTEFADDRFVKFYKRISPFCSKSSRLVAEPQDELLGKSIDLTIASIGGINIDLTGKPNYLTIIIFCAVILFSLIGLGLYAQKMQDRKLAAENRLFVY